MSKKKQYPLRRNVAPALVLPFLPYILGGVVVVGVGMYAKRYLENSPKITAIFSVPTILMGGGTYLFASSMDLKPEMKAVATVVGASIGWGLQYYVLTPLDASIQQQKAAATEAQRDAERRWYNPFSWAGVDA